MNPQVSGIHMGIRDDLDDGLSVYINQDEYAPVSPGSLHDRDHQLIQQGFLVNAA